MSRHLDQALAVLDAAFPEEQCGDVPRVVETLYDHPLRYADGVQGRALVRDDMHTSNMEWAAETEQLLLRATVTYAPYRPTPYRSAVAGRRCNQTQAVGYIARREPFVASALSGEWTTYPSHGWLPREWSDELDRLRREHDGEVYVVYSYATPIGWWTEQSGWVVPNVRYSVTTGGKHQPRVRAGAGYQYRSKPLEG